MARILSRQRVFWVLLLLIAAAVPILAQQGERPPIIHATYVRVKTAMLPEYVKIMKEEVIPAFQKTDMPWVAAWEIWPYGDGPTFLYGTEIPAFAEFDGPHPLMKVLEPEKFQDLMSRMGQCADGYSTFALQHHADVGFMTEGSEPKAAVLWRADVKPGQTQEAMHYMKTEIAPAMKEGGVISLIVLSKIFGEGPDIHAITTLDGFASLDKGHPVMRTRTPEEARRIMSAGSNFFENDSTVTMRRRDDLSYRH